MSSTWISMPIENAKEVAQRYMRSNLAGATNAVLSYDSDCEVYLTTYDFNNFVFLPGFCYVGYIYCGGASGNEESSLDLSLEDNSNNFRVTLSGSSYAIQTTYYPIVWNKVRAQPDMETIFIGYRFNVTY